ncbi:MAG: hypothetical protein NDF54_05535 [archaeon GB-1867-035]|nr:hypothetical protein [Candidatus Culexmicrobium profundum]
MGAEEVKFSISGIESEIASYVKLYQSLGFQIWREASIMQRKLNYILVHHHSFQ